MSDQPTPDHASSDPSKRTGWDAVSETELDAALSQAASLAAELSAQVSSPNDAATSAASASGDNPLDDPSKEVDAGLEKLQELVGSAAEQVEAVQATNNPPQPKALSVPDFMSEFTSPPPPAPPPPPPIPEVSAAEVPVAAAPEPRTMPPPPPRDFQATAGGAVIGKPGVVGSGMMGVVGGPVNIPTMTAPRPAEPHVEAEHKERAAAAAAAAAKTQRAAPLLFVLRGIVALLEFFDRPFVRLGGKVRRILGWVAVAMIGASILVFLRSSR